MHLWTKCIYLLYISNFGTIGLPEFKFSTMALGHSGILIFWDQTQFKSYFDNHVFIFHYCESGGSTSECVHDAGNAENFSDMSHFKIHSLKEDTQYKFIIDVAGFRSRMFTQRYTVEGRTSKKRNSVPEKPDFTWDVNRVKLGVVIKVVWIPCGKKRDCHGKEAGTHFAIKYKTLDLRTISKTIEYSKADHDMPFLFAGRIYEMVVTSINGDFETDSDPQEVFLPPFSGPVHSVRVLPLSDTSVYVSWKDPRRSFMDVHRYYLSHISDSINELHWADYHTRKWEDMKFPRLNRMDHFNQGIVKNLTLNTTYTLFIIPHGPDADRHFYFGLDYRFNYSPQVIQANNLTLGKPDFKFIASSNFGTACMFTVCWLPCMEVYDCKNINPGSGFEFKIENGDETKTYAVQEQSSIIIEIETNSTYQFLGKSVNKFNQSSDSVEKRISCEESEYRKGKLNIEDVQSNRNKSNLKKKREKLEL